MTPYNSSILHTQDHSKQAKTKRNKNGTSIGKIQFVTQLTLVKPTQLQQQQVSEKRIIYGGNVLYFNALFVLCIYVYEYQ